ncbi:MAG: ATP-binding cassette domain-containing protein [Eubacterium sp.]|nr:ATP-binding cassette domain-containing protein [Eubacterium sp.]
MYIELSGINKYFGDYHAAKDISFGLEQGSLSALLGPSGSGKTTILRMIAGLEKQDSGDIRIGDKLLNDVEVKDRQIGFVFQNYALFPYLNVFQNIAYGLKVRKWPKEKIERRVSELIHLTELDGLDKRYPDQLSGGQRQRVAFARALAPDPKVLLLDEPFAAIDAKVRQELRSWLKDMIHRIGVTSIFVTHDQNEAVEVADQIIVTNQGRVEQIGTPIEIYRSPQTPFVAEFIGNPSIVKKIETFTGFGECKGWDRALVRPEFIKVMLPGQEEEGIPQSACEDALVEGIAFRGQNMEVTLNIRGERVRANRTLDQTPLHVGDRVSALIYRVIAAGNDKVKNVQNQALVEGPIYYI